MVDTNHDAIYAARPGLAAESCECPSRMEMPTPPPVLVMRCKSPFTIKYVECLCTLLMAQDAMTGWARHKAQPIDDS